MKKRIVPHQFPIYELGSRVLRETAQPITEFGSETVQLALDLLHTCRAVGGMGLAAPQIGISKRMIVVSSEPNERYPDAPKMQPVVMVNPLIVKRSNAELQDGWEGCLSIPGLRGSIPRPPWVKVTYHSPSGEFVEKKFAGFIARIIQHEIDHLDGKLFIDRVIAWCGNNSSHHLITDKVYFQMLAEQRKKKKSRHSS